jgi:hypothetical protein
MYLTKEEAATKCALIEKKCEHLQPTVAKKNIKRKKTSRILVIIRRIVRNQLPIHR